MKIRKMRKTGRSSNQRAWPRGLLLTLCLLTLFLALPAQSFAAAGSLAIRIGYYGESGEYRLKETFTYSQMDQLCDSIYSYSNVTNVGTVMETMARGVPVTELLTAAGIDPGSVKTLNFRTTDGTHVNNWFVSLNMDTWVNQTRYYYPNLRSHYDNSTGMVVPESGAKDGKVTVPAIIAIESVSTKSPTAVLSQGSMTQEDSYRFCVGQGNLSIGTQVTEVTSNNSAKWIYGVDVTLRGSPSDASDLSLSVGDDSPLVGSTVRITATLVGQDLFEDLVDTQLTFQSSDESIATVDDAGLVTIHKEGTVTITVTTSNGISRSVTLHCSTTAKDPVNQDDTSKGAGNGDSQSSGDGGGTTGGGQATVLGQGIAMKEIQFSPETQAEIAGGVNPLAEAETPPWAPAAAAGFGIMCLLGGGIWKLLNYRKEV